MVGGPGIPNQIRISTDLNRRIRADDGVDHGDVGNLNQHRAICACLIADYLAIID